MNTFIITRNSSFTRNYGAFGHVPDPDCSEYCHDAAKDETLCERCKFYEECDGIPTCTGNGYESKEEN